MMETKPLMGNNGKPRKLHQTCAVYGCKAIVFKMYSFPNPKTDMERFLDWLNACKNPRFNDLTSNHVIFRRGFICEIHFKESDFVPCSNKKLYRFAVPSLHLPIAVTGFVPFEKPQGLDLPVKEQDKSLTNIEPCYDVPFKDLPFLQSTSTEQTNIKTVSEPLNLLFDQKCCQPIKLQKNYNQELISTDPQNDETLESSDIKPLPIVNCRICSAGTIQSFSLLEKPEIAEMLESLISQKISKSDLLPTSICLKCFLNLKLAYNIQQKMLKAEENLQEKLRNFQSTQIICETIKSEIIEEDSDIQITENFIVKNEPLEEPKIKEMKMKKPISEEILITKKPEPCPICNKKFKKLEKHLKGHKEGTSLCDICGVSMSALSLSLHKVNKHKIHSYKCKHCDKIFTNVSRKELHEVRDHNGRPKHMCEICGKRFYLAKYLRLHLSYVHYKNRPFVCDICSASYRSSHALKIHQRVHSKIMPFECQVCCKKFAVNWRLRNHLLKKHQLIENLDWECKECNKKFATEPSLTLHSRIHY